LRIRRNAPRGLAPRPRLEQADSRRHGIGRPNDIADARVERECRRKAERVEDPVLLDCSTRIPNGAAQALIRAGYRVSGKGGFEHAAIATTLRHLDLMETAPGGR